MAVLIFKQGNYTETGSLAYAEPIFFTDANTLIISGGVSTYANTEVSPQITAGRVDYRVATMDSINTGSFIVTSDVSASNLLLDGNATIRGNITMGGSGLDFGDASDDNVVFKADISSSIIPNDTAKFDLGSDCFKMFGLYTKMMPYTYYSEAKTENWIEVIEKKPPGTENHPEPKYWK